ncbi:MAG: protein-L-isoaspartate(D-aspartate) O-methyltransferase, partial [Chitinophagales bacterium]
MELKDTFKQRGERAQLVGLLKKKGIEDPKVLAAIDKVPRHFFIPDNAFYHRAYEDTAFPIEAGQTISQPYTVAFQTQLLEVAPKDKILEIGTGSGYQAVVLSVMGAKVYSIERQKKLYDQTKALLEKLPYRNIRTFYGDGFEGKEAYAPYDKILITAAAPELPKKLMQQLKVGGYLVIPFGEGNTQTMMRFTKISEKEFEQE